MYLCDGGAGEKKTDEERGKDGEEEERGRERESEQMLKTSV